MGGRDEESGDESSSSSSSDEVLLHDKHRKKLQEQMRSRQKRKRSEPASSSTPRSLGEVATKTGLASASAPVSAASMKMDHLCGVCERASDDLFVCMGPCVSAFHLACLRLDGSEPRPSREQWMCPACTKKQHVCFHCKQVGYAAQDGGEAEAVPSKDGEPPVPMRPVIKCCALSCGKFYHQECITKLPLARIAGARFVCPLHTCAACDESGAQKESVRCTRCPVAYHTSCLPKSGVVNLPGKRIVCPKHRVVLEEKVTKKTEESVSTAPESDHTNESAPYEEKPDEVQAESSGKGHSKRDKKRKKKRKKSRKGRNQESTSVDDEDETPNKSASDDAGGSADDADLKTPRADNTKAIETNDRKEAKVMDSPQPESPPATISSLFGSPDLSKERIKAKLDEVLGQSDDENDEETQAKKIEGSEDATEHSRQSPPTEVSSVKSEYSTAAGVPPNTVLPTETEQPLPNLDELTSALKPQSSEKGGTFGDLSVKIPEVITVSRSSASSEEDESGRGSMSVRSRSGRERPSRSKKKKLKRTKSGDTKKTESGDVALADDDSPKVSKVEAQWVQCDNCKKWRTVPSDVDLNTMPEKWYCHMNTWNRLYSSCEAPEEIEEKRKEAIADTVNASSAPPEKKIKLNHARQMSEDASSDAVGSGTEGSTNKNLKKHEREAKKRKLKQELKEKYGKVKWVQCENAQCGKWRVVPPSVDCSQLPSVWYCNLNTWAPELASCSAPNPPEVEFYLQKSQSKKQTPGRPSKKQKTGESTPSSGSTSNAPLETKQGKNVKAPRSTPSHGNPSSSTFATGGRGDAVSQVRGKVDPSKHTVLEWAQCEKCNKWRKLPQHIKSSTLPDKWYCSMNHWDPARASCSVPQEQDQEPLPNHGSRKHGRLSFAEMLFASTGQLRKTYTAESSMLQFEYDGVLYHRDDQYKHSSMYVVPPHALKRPATNPRRPSSTGPAVDSPAYHKLVAEIADAILKALDLRTTHSVADIVDTISATRHSNSALSLGVITAALAMLSNKGLIEKVDRRSHDPTSNDEDAHKGRSALSRLALYRKVPKRPLKALKAWKLDTNATLLDHAR